MKPIALLLSMLFLLVSCERNTSTIVHEPMAHGRFSAVRVYEHDGNMGPPLLLITNADTDTAVIPQIIDAAMKQNIDVFVVSKQDLLQDFATQIVYCNNLSGDFDNLARYLEAYLQQPNFLSPVLASTSGSHSFVESIVGVPQAEVFAGQLTFTNDTASTQATTNLTTESPKNEASCKVQQNIKSKLTTSIADYNIAINHGQLDATQFALAYQHFQEAAPAAQILDEEVAELPLTEVTVENQNSSDTFAVLVSGDGGWAGFDKDLAEALQTQGIPVVGWDSLRYFWQPRSPESFTSDLDKVISHYAVQWHKQHVLLIGFSQGANVIPFALDLLTPANKAMLSKIALVSPERYAEFEFHLSNWVNSSTAGLPLMSKLPNYEGVPLYCLYGSDDKDAICPELKGTHVTVQGFEAGHHPYDHIDDIVKMLVP